MDTRLHAKTLTCCAILLLIAGCGGESLPTILPAHGVLLLDGDPLPNAQVRFIPQIDFGPQYIATAVTDEQGRFALQCFAQSGACKGENLVTVSEAAIPADLLSEHKQRELADYRRSLKNRPIPRNYATPVHSPLSVTVSESQAEHRLELKR
jgi:hypothetical protein